MYLLIKFTNQNRYIMYIIAFFKETNNNIYDNVLTKQVYFGELNIRK